MGTRPTAVNLRAGLDAVAPAGTRALNPAFDVTPHALIDGIVAEAGIVPANAEAIAAALVRGRGDAP